MNGYDFDKTIYSKDSSVEFYFFLLKKKPYLVFHLIYFSFNFCLYKLKLISKISAKEKMFSIMNYFLNIDELVEEFWQNKSLNEWYIKQNKKNDVIISASPEFLLSVICKKYNINNLIATIVDKKTGKFMSPNCYGEEKVKRFKKKYENIILNAFYTDSYSDMCMLEVSKKIIIVKKEKKEVLLNEKLNKEI